MKNNHRMELFSKENQNKVCTSLLVLSGMKICKVNQIVVDNDTFTYFYSSFKKRKY